VRQIHLGPKVDSESKDSEDSDDHEEEFYYTEVEMVVKKPSHSHATSSTCLTSTSQTASSHSTNPPENPIWRSPIPVSDASKEKQSSFPSSLHSKSTEIPLDGSARQQQTQQRQQQTQQQQQPPTTSNLLPNQAAYLPLPNSEALPSPKIIHATPSTDHDYTAKIQNTSTASFGSLIPSQSVSPLDKERMIDIFLAMEQSKQEQPLFLGSSQNRPHNPHQFSHLRLTPTTEAYSIGNYAANSTHRNLTWSTQAHPTLTGNISLPKPIRPNMVPASPGTSITSPSFTGSFPGTHYQTTITHNSPKMIISTSLGVACGGIGKPHSKKIRGEMKKCRKVYGMENRDMWCTQCRWKKACTRFTE